MLLAHARISARLGCGQTQRVASDVDRRVRAAQEGALREHRLHDGGVRIDMSHRSDELAGGRHVQGGTERGQHAHVDVLLAIGAPEQNHGRLRAEALGHGEPARLANHKIARGHEFGHAFHVLEHRGV